MRVGNYTLLELLGRGGTSEVYAAEDALGEPVAVKVLRPALVLDPATVSAFIGEGVRTRDLAHPNLVRVLDVGSDAATGSCYLVMERIAGESLAARLARQARIDEPTLRAIAAELADGMHAAHARGIVHRDLKPGNIMLRGSATRDLEASNDMLCGNAPVIIDFGIAKSLGASSAVVTERRVGTLAYMAPEQLADGLITPAADIWALGVILFEAATGQLPFASFHEGRLPQLVETAPRAATLAPVSPALDDLIARCLERDPGKRPQSMAAIASVLRGHADERITEDVGARVLASPRVAAPSRRRRWPMIAGAAAIAAAAGTVLAFATADSEHAAAPVDAAPPTVVAPAPMPATNTPTPDASIETTARPEPVEENAAPPGPVEEAAVEITEVEPRAAADEPARAQAERNRKRTTKRTKPRDKRATKESRTTRPREKRTTSQGETLD